jgi:uncharacterized protein YcfJ
MGGESGGEKLAPLFTLGPRAKTKKKRLLLISALAVSPLTWAQDLGTVLSSTPIVQSVAVPRQVCSVVQMEVQQPKSGVGAAVGAVAGAVLGSSVGHGPGRGVATAAGAVTGAILGDRIEGPGGSQTTDVQQCQTQTIYENRTVAYNVVYEYAGRQYTVQMPNDPGPTIRLQVTPVGASTQTVMPAAPVPQVVYQQPPVVFTAPRAYYPYTYAYPYYPGPYVYGWGYGGGRHRH